MLDQIGCCTCKGVSRSGDPHCSGLEKKWFSGEEMKPLGLGHAINQTFSSQDKTYLKFCIVKRGTIIALLSAGSLALRQTSHFYGRSTNPAFGTQKHSLYSHALVLHCSYVVSAACGKTDLVSAVSVHQGVPGFTANPSLLNLKLFTSNKFYLYVAEYRATFFFYAHIWYL